jgi:hypothetical protein
MRILKSIAHQNPSTVKPGTILLVRRMISALITKRNKPNVTIVTGRVRRIRSGLSKIFKTPSTKAIINAVPKLST